jgi:TolB protein
MLTRAYRITDRTTVMLLKLIEAITDAVISILLGILAVLALVVQGFVGLILLVLRLILRVLSLILGGIGLLLGLFVAGIRRIVYGAGSPSREAAAASRSRSDAGTTMAKRAERVEDSFTRTLVVEDPARRQNRWLSVALVTVGVMLAGALLWATNPAETAAPRGRTALAGGMADLIGSGTTPEAAATPLSLVVAGPTAVPTATEMPRALVERGAIAYVGRESAQTDIWAVNVGSRTPIRITNSPADERDPAWSPDGSQLAFASRQDGNWELYVYDTVADETTRLTYDLSFQGGPSWSPDGQWLVYESYQGGNLDIYVLPVDGSAPPQRVTDHEAPDFSPAWSPDGRRIAFTSLRDGNREIYVFDLDTLESQNITQTPLRNEDGASWSADGTQLAYSAFEAGQGTVFIQSVSEAGVPAAAFSLGRDPVWSPQGGSIAFMVDSLDGRQTFLYAVPADGTEAATEVVTLLPGAGSPTWSDSPLAAQIVNRGSLPLQAPSPLFAEQENPRQTDPPYRLDTILDTVAPNAVLSERVNDSFNAAREAVLERTGRDLLGQLDDAFWDDQRRPQPGEERRNWHMTGRAIALARSAILGFPPQIEVVREDRGLDTFWRLYLRVTEDEQTGQLGEPLRALPWDFLSRTQGDVEAYNQGGRFRQSVPSGYYVDLTQLLADFGWERMAASSDWRANTNGVNYWMAVQKGGLDWYAAMREIYAESQLGGFVPTSTPGVATSATGGG